MNLVLTEERLGLSTRPRYYITRQAGCISISKAIRATLSSIILHLLLVSDGSIWSLAIGWQSNQ